MNWLTLIFSYIVIPENPYTNSLFYKFLDEWNN